MMILWDEFFVVGRNLQKLQTLVLVRETKMATERGGVGSMGAAGSGAGLGSLGG